MANIKNDAQIDEIFIEKTLEMFCPMGGHYYRADVEILIEPNEEIMDYCDTDNYLEAMCGESYTVEDAAKHISDYIVAQVKPRWSEVKVKTAGGAHMPVTVTKRYGESLYLHGEV